LEEEVLVLAAHGLWHLLGHDHQKEEDWEGFRRVQERILTL
jgi:probable rRNA maturation factor